MDNLWSAAGKHSGSLTPLMLYKWHDDKCLVQTVAICR